MSIPDNEFVTIQPDEKGIRICRGVGITNCYLNPTHTPGADASETSYCLTDTKIIESSTLFLMKSSWLEVQQPLVNH